MARLNWTDQAILDLVNIADFIAKDSVRYAKITVTRIRVASNQLKKYPLIGRAVPETAKESIQPEYIYFFSLYPFAIF
jgi:plasmid stabilization system protein ParE